MPEPRAARGRARPRAGLLGNPSDLYGGAVLAFTFDDFQTEVVATPASRLELVDGTGQVQHVQGSLAPRRHSGGAELLAAAALRFAGAFPALELGCGERARVRLQFRSDVPRQAGLSGSSAIVIAALRALCEAYRVRLAPFDLAEHALAAEALDLRIVAGPQDRVVQAYEGLLAMDFRPPRAPSKVERLSTALLPPLAIAWHAQPGADSGATHSDVYRRWQAGDPVVRDTLARFPELVWRGREALLAGRQDELADLVDANFDLRASLFPIDPRDRELVDHVRALGFAAKFCGSGGAVLCVARAGGELLDLEERLDALGYRCLRPTVPR